MNQCASVNSVIYLIWQKHHNDDSDGCFYNFCVLRHMKRESKENGIKKCTHKTEPTCLRMFNEWAPNWATVAVS